MLRKIFLFATFLLMIVTASAQSVGEWTIFTRFAGNVDDFFETKEKVYFTSGKRLFSYDKESNELYTYTTRNKLNDTNITIARYNPEGKYLFIGYDTSNIDLLYDNGRVVNMSDIKDATLTYNKGINSVIFADNKIYLGTEFGIVIYDDQKHEVMESGIYGESIQSVFPVQNYLFIHRLGANGNSISYAPLNGHHNTIDKFTHFTNMKAPWMNPAGESSIIYKNNNDGDRLSRYTFKFTDGVLDRYGKMETFDIVPTMNVVLTDNGNYVMTAKSLELLDSDGAPATSIALPAALQGKSVATYNGAKSVWVSDVDGIANYEIDGDDVTLLADKFKPEGIYTDRVFFLRYDKTGALWMGNLGVTQYKGGLNGDYYWYKQATTRMKDGKAENMNVYVASTSNSTVKGEQNIYNSTEMYGGTSGFAIDPDFPDRYYQGNNLEGLYIIENNEELAHYSQGLSNAPFVGAGWQNTVMDVAFDPEGNLWVANWTKSGNSPVWVLPKETLRGKELSTISKDDWLETKHKGQTVGNKDLTLLICEKSPVVFTFCASWHGTLDVLKTKGTWSNTSDDEFFRLIDAIDQDGKSWSPGYITCGVEDKRGRVWIGTSDGVVEIANPAAMTSTSPVTRLKVPRNDGTNYADYLCDAEQVYAIAVDNSNRKWIATQTSGVYLVSENGDEIIEHFTMDNSPLPDNCVLSVACDPNSNTVYFGTMSGLISYNSTSSPSAEDYSQVYAYPNPVRPDYTGYITIAGLMDNSLVKITDSTGNVVYQTRSEGGMATWDGFDSNHNKAKTGVYYVFASQNENGSSSGAVTKILIVR